MSHLLRLFTYRSTFSLPTRARRLIAPILGLAILCLTAVSVGFGCGSCGGTTGQTVIQTAESPTFELCAVPEVLAIVHCIQVKDGACAFNHGMALLACIAAHNATSAPPAPPHDAGPPAANSATGA